MSGDAQPRAPHIEPFERAKKLFLQQLSEEEHNTYKNANPDNLFYQASVLHSGYIRSSKLQKCRDTLMPLVRAVKEYGELLASPLSSAPVVGTFVGPIWGGLRVIIHFAQAVDEYFEDLITMLGRIGKTLPQYGDYHRLFPNHGRLMLLLSESLASILTFCKKVKDHFNNEEPSGKWSNKLRGHKGSRKHIGLSIPDYLDDFDKAKREIEQEAQISHMDEDKKHHTRQEEQWALQEGRSRQMRLKEALSTLSKVNYKNRRQQLRSERCTGTGEWLIQESSFKMWLERPSSGCFYCFGIPGSGKSVLSSAIADYLDEQFSSPEDFRGFYFCDYKDLPSLKCSILSGTLIRQALDLSPQPQMLVNWVLEHVDDGNSQPSTEQLVDALKRVMGSRKRVFLVLDGIDELDRAEQINLRRVMQSFMSLEESIVKIFVSCRAGVPELDSDLYPAVKLTITPENVRSDILHYIEQTVESKYRSEELQLGDASLRQEIVQALIAGAKEMFLWVTFQVEELCFCYNDEQIRETLNNLPEGLTVTYARILQRISRSKGGQKALEIAGEAFKWVICAVRPLQVEELFEALAIKETDSRFHRDRVMTDTKKFIQACGNLITVQVDGTVRPAHHTVQQFLLRDHVEERHEPVGVSNESNESLPSYSKHEYVATNAGSVKSSHLRGIEHVRFFLEEGDRQLGHLCIAYLLFEDFESQVAVREPNRIQVPAEIVNSIGSGFYGPSAVAGKVMSKFQGHSTLGNDFKNMALSIPKPKSQDKQQSLNKDYKLLEYTRLFWPFHINNLTNNDQTGRAAIIAFVREYPFETRPWRTNQYIKSLPKFRGERRSQRFHEGRLLFYWALEHKVQFFHHILSAETVPSPDMELEWKKSKLGLRGAVVGYEIAQDTPNQNLVVTAATWGPAQLDTVFANFWDMCISALPIEMLYQAFVVGSSEVHQFLCNALINDWPKTHGIAGIAFDEWYGNERVLRLLGRSIPWYERGWLDVSKDPQRIMSEIFVMSFPKGPNVMKFVFPRLEEDTRNQAVSRIVREAKSGIQRASNDTKRNFIIESLVGILYPTFPKEVQSIHIEAGMEKWQDKWDKEVKEANHLERQQHIREHIRVQPTTTHSDNEDRENDESEQRRRRVFQGLDGNQNADI